VAQRERAEADEARALADKERAEADEAKAVAQRERAEADEARAVAEREKAEADEARQAADRERAEAAAASAMAEGAKAEAEAARAAAHNIAADAEGARLGAAEKKKAAEAMQAEAASIMREAAAARASAERETAEAEAAWAAALQEMSKAEEARRGAEEARKAAEAAKVTQPVKPPRAPSPRAVSRGKIRMALPPNLGLSAKDTKAWMGGTAAIRQEIEAKYVHNAPLASLQGKDDQADAPEPTSPNKWDARVEAAKEFASSVDSGASGPKQPSPVRSPGRSSSVRRARLAPSEVPPECLSAKDTIAWVSGNAAKREQIEKKYEAIMAARS